MKRDFSSCMLAALIGLPIFLIVFIIALYVGNCGFSTNCSPVAQPAIIHTPIPTLVLAAFPVSSTQVAASTSCTLTASELLSTWVASGSKASDLFDFRDKYGTICESNFDNVLPLFTAANFWYPGAPACTSCHTSDVTTAAANLDLTSYQGILAGGKRSSPDSKGEDILGGGDWQNALLNKVLFVYQTMPPGAPAGTLSAGGPIIIAGGPVVMPTQAPTEGPSEEEIARPGNPGGPGNALSLTGNIAKGQTVYIDYCQICHGENGVGNIPNPGSDDQTIPPLNPIDPTIASTDPATFAYNVDLFVENGSTPEGPNAAFQMPAWGRLGLLTQQQIADVIAYVISLNK